MIYVCIPAHDEAATLGVLLWKTRKVLGEFGRDYMVVVHDDGSTDDTQAVLARYKRALPVTVLHSNERVGYAHSVEKLLRHVAEVSQYPKRDCAVVLQGDFTENPEDMVSLLKVIEGGADIVAGAIEPDGPPAPKAMVTARRLAGIAIRSLRKAPVSDPLTGMRAYRIIVLRKALRDLPRTERFLHSEGWAANVELLGRLAPHARRIGEAPLHLRYDLRTRPSRFRAFPTLLSLWRLRAGAFWTAAPAEVA